MTSKLFYQSDSPHWNSVNWKHAEKNIANLQHRITMATKRGDNQQVRNLQRLLVRSLSGRLKAVRQVAQENQNKKTPGIDGKLWTTPQQKFQAALDLRKKSKTLPLRRIFIPKKDGSLRLNQLLLFEGSCLASGCGLRPLGIPAIRDRAAQAVWNFALLPVVEQTSDAAFYGFHPYRSCWDAFAQIRTVFSKKNSAEWVLVADIRKMFDTIDHNWLLENTPVEKKILKSWLKSGFFAGNEFSLTESGTPQVGIIFPTLANLTLNGLEVFLEKRFSKPCVQSKAAGHRFNEQGTKTGGYHPTKINVVRYENDFIVSGRSARQLELVRSAIETFLKPRGLQFHEDKNCITRVHSGFHFLGWKFWKTPNGAFLGQISRSSLKAHQEKIKNTIKESGNLPTPALIRKLNEQINGWTNYHRCSDGLWKVWGKMNKYVYELLWKWARKRHGKRSHTWIYNHHWLHLDGRRTFFAKELANFAPTEQSMGEKPLTAALRLRPQGFSNRKVNAEKLYTLKPYSARKILIRRLPASIKIFDLGQEP
uniref:Putative reverse transcriptase and intron maturase n=1 Tax=Rhexinema sarcinoideum TaxID=43261 RepID=A0A1B2RYT3_9CHLO|nr:putative reverse transcriptase and intron maturase [Rhexinema sarcinoideum]